MDVSCNNNKDNNGNINPKGAETEKIQERINRTIGSSKDVGGSSIITKPVRQVGEAGLEVHPIQPVNPKNKRLKEIVDKKAANNEETEKISKVTLEVSEKGRIEKERAQEKSEVVDT